MFSDRTHWNRAPNALARGIEARRATERPLLDLTESNPTKVALAPPEGVLELLSDARGRAYASDPRGLQVAREAVCRDFARRGAKLDPERVLLTASSSEAYAHLFKLLCDPGDRIVVPRPSYPLFDYLAALESVAVDGAASFYDGGWRLDLEDLEARLTGRTRAVVVVHPNNPTGAFLAKDQVQPLRELCARHGVALISDEVFADYVLPGTRPQLRSLVEDDSPALCFVLGGLSKTCALPQLKLGWIAVCGPEGLRREALERLEIVSDTYLSVSTPIQWAAGPLLERASELQRPVRTRVERNLACLRQALGPTSPVDLLPPEGGWSAVLRVPATLTEEQRVSELLERDGVLVHPGFFFDFDGEAYLVLSLLPEPGVFDRGVACVLADALR